MLLQIVRTPELMIHFEYKLISNDNSKKNRSFQKFQQAKAKNPVTNLRFEMNEMLLYILKTSAMTIHLEYKMIYYDTFKKIQALPVTYSRDFNERKR